MVSINQTLISIVMPCFQQAPFWPKQSAPSSIRRESQWNCWSWTRVPRTVHGNFSPDAVGVRRPSRLLFEPDDGQSDAVNRGLALARGRSLAGSTPMTDFVRMPWRALPTLLDHDRPGWVYGRAGIINDRGEPVSKFIVRYKNWRGRRFSRLKLLTEDFIPQMAVFWNRALWERAGGLDMARHLDMDYDQWLRFSRVLEPVVLPFELADFRVHGQPREPANR